jgi:hypothetical protein
MLKVMKKVIFLICLCAVSPLVFAQNLIDDNIPLQQFVVADSPKDAQPAQSESEAAGEINLAQAQQPAQPQSVPPPQTDLQGFPIFPAHAPAFPPPQTPAQIEARAQASTIENGDEPAVRTPIPLSSSPFGEEADGDQSANNDFAGGLDEQAFIVCARMATGVCIRAKSDQEFKVCLARLKQQPACEQFVDFANSISYGLRDEVDLVQYYKEGQLTLVHVVRMGQSYPGDYYAVSGNGGLLNITSGPEVKGININKDLRYPEIISRFPKVQLWSVVNQLPLAAISPNGGLRLIFRFSLLNGCATCDLAGYANVAFDFSDTGMLQGVSLQSLDPVLQ